MNSKLGHSITTSLTVHYPTLQQQDYVKYRSEINVLERDLFAVKILVKYIWNPKCYSIYTLDWFFFLE